MAADAGALADAGTVPADAGETDAPSPARRRVRLVLLVIAPLLLLVLALYAYGRGGTVASTDNAYVKQDRVDVTALVSADVRRVAVAENSRVQPGQTVLELDDEKLRAAAASAAADLANARLTVQTLRAEYAARVAERQVARETAAYARRQYARQRELVDRRLVAEAALDEVRHAAENADGAVGVLDLQVAEAEARLGGHPGLPVDAHPAVRAAAAELERAQVDLDHAAMRAPQAGIVSHLPQVGDHVVEGRAAFAIIVNEEVYVEANLKETDLGWVEPGQAARVVVDLYPDVVWHGRVASVAQATGAEFSLLPAQNASGNWVKVVQRIPVRIVLERDASMPVLRSGASAEVEIQTAAPTRLQRWLARLRN